MSAEALWAAAAFVLAAICALCTGLFALFSMIGRVKDGAAKDLAAAIGILNTKIEGNKETLESKLVAVQERASKAIHDSNNNITLTIADLRKDMENIRSTAANKEELKASELRITTAMAEFKGDMKNDLKDVVKQLGDINKVMARIEGQK